MDRSGAGFVAEYGEGLEQARRVGFVARVAAWLILSVRFHPQDVLRASYVQR